MLTTDDIRAMDADLAEHGTLPEADQRRLIAELSARTQEVASGSGALTSDLRDPAALRYLEDLRALGCTTVEVGLEALIAICGDARHVELAAGEGAR